MPERLIPADAATAIGDFARYPGCRLRLACTACDWSRAYHPERVIHRLQELRTGGYATRLVDVARRVQWTCPTCGRLRWRMQFAWPADMTESEAKRLAARARN
jgi:hypothetical protein